MCQKGKLELVVSTGLRLVVERVVIILAAVIIDLDRLQDCRHGLMETERFRRDPIGLDLHSLWSVRRLGLVVFGAVISAEGV